MHLEQVRLQNFRCYSDQGFNLGSRPVQVFLAPNGGGKTALIDGFACFLGLLPWAIMRRLAPESAPIQHGDVRQAWDPQADRLLCSTSYPAVVEGQVTTGAGELDWGRALNKPDSRFNEKLGRATDLVAAFAARPPEEPLPLVARYSTGRFAGDVLPRDGEQESPPPARDPQVDLQRALQRRGQPERWQGYSGCMSGGVNWSAIREWWMIDAATAALRDQPQTEALQGVVEAVGTLLQLAAPPRFDLDAGDVLVQLDDGQAWTPVRHLSDGYRATFALAADLARRGAMLNPHLGAAAAKETQGVVLIDEVDLHLHPAWQREILRRLNVAFPMLQFVVTTHAPQVVVGAGAELADVFVLEEGKGGAPVPVKVSYEPGSSADDLLTGPWFKLPSAVDDHTDRVIEEHARLFREFHRDPTKRPEYEAKARELRALLHRSVGSSVEDLVMDVVYELAASMERPLSELSWAELQDLRGKALAALGVVR